MSPHDETDLILRALSMMCTTSFNLTYFILTLGSTYYSYTHFTGEENEALGG